MRASSFLHLQGAHSAQGLGEVRDRVFDTDGSPLPGAIVYSRVNGELFGTTSDLDGRFVLKPLHPGRCAITISFSGRQPLERANEAVLPDRITWLRYESSVAASIGFMDETMGRLAGNDHKGCVDDPRIALQQCPADASPHFFFGGLCACNLGWHQRAEALLERAAAHRVPVFDEEAAWCLAQARERLGQAEAARAACGRIAAGGGFYAQRAAGRLRR